MNEAHNDPVPAYSFIGKKKKKKNEPSNNLQ